MLIPALFMCTRLGIREHAPYCHSWNCPPCPGEDCGAHLHVQQPLHGNLIGVCSAEKNVIGLGRRQVHDADAFSGKGGGVRGNHSHFSHAAAGAGGVGTEDKAAIIWYGVQRKRPQLRRKAGARE